MCPRYSSQGSNLAIKGTNPTALERLGPFSSLAVQTEGRVSRLSTVFPYKT